MTLTRRALFAALLGLPLVRKLKGAGTPRREASIAGMRIVEAEWMPRNEILMLPPSPAPLSRVHYRETWLRTHDGWVVIEWFEGRMPQIWRPLSIRFEQYPPFHLVHLNADVLTY